jgi:hypothetical protein
MLQRFTKLIIWSGTLAAIILLAAWPSGVGAEETSIPPEARWTPTPPAPRSFDSRQLAEFLLTKGMISPQDMAALERSTEQSRVGELKKWSEKPLSSSHPIDSHQLTDLLLTKGMISPQDIAALERNAAEAKARELKNWSEKPLSSSHPIDSHQLADLLLTKGMISTQEMAALERGETPYQGGPASSHVLAPGVSR